MHSKFRIGSGWTLVATIGHHRNKITSKYVHVSGKHGSEADIPGCTVSDGKHIKYIEFNKSRVHLRKGFRCHLYVPNTQTYVCAAVFEKYYIYMYVCIYIYGI